MSAGPPVQEQEHDLPVRVSDAARIGIVAAGAAAVWFRVWEPFPRFSVLGIVTLLIGGWPILREAAENALQRRMTMELSMSIALIAAAAIGEFFTALVIALFVLVAEILEELTVSRGRRAIQDLLRFLPQTVTVRRDSEVQEVSLSDLLPGDLVVVAPGARLAADGTVVSGRSFVDQAAITGESVPVEKAAGALVYAGTINQSGSLEFRVDRLGRDTSFGKIVEAVERAEHSRAPIQKVADRYAAYLVYFAIGAAILTFAVTRNMRSTISVVIVAGACGIAAGTPLAILGGIGQAARRGAIVKGGLFLEALSTIDTAVFDKTGTVTFGRPEVRDLRPEPGVAPRVLLEAAAIAERRSEHPLGKAIIERAVKEGIPVTEPRAFAYHPGRGVAATLGGVEILAGNRTFLRERGIPVASSSGEERATSEVVIARSGVPLGAIYVADTVRPEALKAIRSLKAMGMRTILLTGDARAVGEAVGRELGVDQVEAELLPEAKLARIDALVSSKRKVAMVGDGVNDAPALAAATVGVAMGSGTDVARESADVVLLGNDLSGFVEAVRVARRTRRVIRQNFVGTLAVDAIGVGLAGFGLLNPLLAAFVHVASELTFILNSARLLPAPTRR
ncbi:MAG TPA: cation-translocating P-type ATPase [Thermoanaerobaculia bacterium]|nr:cation-translocating P-type ATPase [Thermoanaerobaculia bacterium]